jgi:hypothetical protein
LGVVCSRKWIFCDYKIDFFYFYIKMLFHFPFLKFFFFLSSFPFPFPFPFSSNFHFFQISLFNSNLFFSSKFHNSPQNLAFSFKFLLFSQNPSKNPRPSKTRDLSIPYQVSAHTAPPNKTAFPREHRY